MDIFALFSITNVEAEILATACIKQIRTAPLDKTSYVCRVVFCYSFFSFPKDIYCCSLQGTDLFAA
jgi:hypothetical protein